MTDDPKANVATTVESRLGALAGVAADRVGRLRDEVALKLHLAGREAVSGWLGTVEPSLRAIEARLRDAADAAGGAADEAFHRSEIGLTVTLALMDARDRWQAIEPQLRWMRTQALDAGDAAARALAETVPDDIALRAHLARLDAQQMLDERRERARRIVSDAAGSVAGFARGVLETITRGADRPR